MKLRDCRINFRVFLKFISSKVLNIRIFCPEVFHSINVFRTTTLRKRSYTVAIFYKFFAISNFLICYHANI
uniref:Uncharacterized protein n=1 Tax=Arundo donax TaxID=35708 RepID=A0A0A9DUM4_ARUDO